MKLEGVWAAVWENVEDGTPSEFTAKTLYRYWEWTDPLVAPIEDETIDAIKSQEKGEKK